MIYKNIKTGAVINSSCIISGGDWVVEDQLPDETIEDEVVNTKEQQELSETKNDEQIDEPVDLASLTVEKLQDLAKQRGINLGTATRKADIIEVILDAM